MADLTGGCQVMHGGECGRVSKACATFSAFSFQGKAPLQAGHAQLACYPRHPQQAWRHSMEFKGKVALITGAGNGIGRAAALGFAARGAQVVAVDLDGAAAERTAATLQQQGGAALAVRADVTKSADVAAYVKATLDAYGR